MLAWFVIGRNVSFSLHFFLPFAFMITNSSLINYSFPHPHLKTYYPERVIHFYQTKTPDVWLLWEMNSSGFQSVSFALFIFL